MYRGRKAEAIVGPGLSALPSGIVTTEKYSASLLPNHQCVGITAMRVWILPTLVGLLSACAASGVQVKEEQLQQFQTGKTTYQEVTSALGAPNFNMINADGTRTIMYTYAEAQVRPETFIPYIGPFVGGTDMRTNNVTLMFDQNGVLQNFTAAEGQTGTGMGIASGTTVDRVEDQPQQAP
jgi:outer membrane protein assembly factor BamE (lipoprotein component of BamABCDE complex)